MTLAELRRLVIPFSFCLNLVLLLVAATSASSTSLSKESQIRCLDDRHGAVEWLEQVKPFAQLYLQRNSNVTRWLMNSSGCDESFKPFCERVWRYEAWNGMGPAGSRKLEVFKKLANFVCPVTCNACTEFRKTMSVTAPKDGRYRKVKQLRECNSKDEYHGLVENVESCAQAAAAAGNRFFIYGLSAKGGKCFSEHTANESCPEGWELDLYDFWVINADRMKVAAKEPEPIGPYEVSSVSRPDICSRCLALGLIGIMLVNAILT